MKLGQRLSPLFLARLARIGFDRVLGALDHPAATLLEHPEHVEQLSRLSALTLDQRRATILGLVLVDVRNAGEVALGTIDGARHMPLPALLTSLDSLDSGAPTVVFCEGGYRSVIAASLLRAHGFADVSDLLGGFSAWRQFHHREQAAVR